MTRRCTVALVLLMSCADDESAPPPATPADPCVRNEDLDAVPMPESYEYDWSCTGVVPPESAPLPDAPVADDCTTGVWPDLDDTVDVCPTVSDAMRQDPVSGKDLPSADPRSLPREIAITESGTFLPPSAPDAWPSRIRIVAWNMEYTAHLDEQLETLTTHPDLANADVYLLSEVDRCSTRNGVRRAARLLAEALEAQYVYGIEFVELNIDRDIGGDTGQAILSRRPMTSASLLCHTSQFDWFASEEEPRLGQRVVLHADVPVGPTSVRVYAAHLESNDIFGDKRAIQSKEFLDVAQARACDRPQIFAGDLNAPYCGSPELQVIRDAGFIDAIGIAGDTEPTHQNGFRLDYVWARGFVVKGGGVVRGLDASDHDALWVELELAP